MSAPWSTAEWERFLARELGCPVRVAFGRSRTVPVQAASALVGARGEGLEVRMHRMFEAAPDDVRTALARWLRSGRRARRACVRLDGWIDLRLSEEPAAAPRRLRVEPAGRRYDLAALSTPLFEDEFAGDFRDGRPRPALTWGRRGRSASRRSLRLGSYDVDAHVVRIHRVLDQASVPPWFVRFVLMHEILHAALPPRRVDGGRWVHHGPDFRAREASYPDYRAALRWEERNLPRLIAAARSGEPFRPVAEPPRRRTPPRRPREEDAPVAVQRLLFT